MSNPEEFLNDQKKWFSDGGIPAREGMYFYLIIAVSLLLPIVIALCVFFTDVVVTILITSLLLALLGFLIHAYHKVKRQFKEFNEAIEKLSLLEGDHEISILGGLISVKIEEAMKQLPPGEAVMIEEKQEKD